MNRVLRGVIFGSAGILGMALFIVGIPFTAVGEWLYGFAWRDQDADHGEETP